MPILTASVSELSHHVLETASRQIVTRFLTQMGLNNTIGDKVYIKTKYSSISDTTDGELNARLRDDRFVADVTMQVNPTSVKWSEVLTFNHSHSHRIGTNMHRGFPIFNDREFGIGVYELAAPCSILMQCSIHIQDRALAYSLPLKFFNTFHDSSIVSLINLQYEYKLPDEIIYILGNIYNHKRFTTKFDSFYHYLQYWSNSTIGKTVSSTSHDRPELVVNKMNVECLSMVEYSEEEPTVDTTDSGANMFNTSFTMTTQFNMVNALAIDYPVMIENRLLPIEAIPLPKELRDKFVDGTLIDQGVNNFREQYRYLHREYIQTPFYDDWVVSPHCHLRDNYHAPYFIGLCTIDEDYPSTIVDLKDNLGDDYMLPDISKQILMGQERIRPGGSLLPDAILTVSKFYGDKQIDASDLYFTPDLVLEDTGRLINHPYRLVLSQLIDFDKLNPIYYPLLLEFIKYVDYKVIEQLWILNERGAIELELSFHDVNKNTWVSKDLYVREQYNPGIYPSSKWSKDYTSDNTIRPGAGSGLGGGGSSVSLSSVDKIRFTDLSNYGSNPNYGKSYTMSLDNSKDKVVFQDIVTGLKFKHGDKYGDRIITRIIRADIIPIRGRREY